MLFDKKAWAIYLFPFLFYLMGVYPSASYVQPQEILKHLLIFLSINYALYTITALFFKSKAAFRTVYLIFLAIYAFFTPLKTALISLPLLNSYLVVFITLTAVIIFLFLILRRKEGWALNCMKYLNILLFVFLLFHTVLLIWNFKVKPAPLQAASKLTSVQAENLPNFYLILFDGYPGNYSLKRHFDLDNLNLNEGLRQRDIFVPDTFYSNYNWTVPSMASLLNLTYLDEQEVKPINKNTFVFDGFKMMRNNSVTSFFEEIGMRIENQSIFPLGSHTEAHNFFGHSSPVKAQHNLMLHKKLERDLVWHLYKPPFNWESVYEKYVFGVKHMNDKLMAQTLDLANELKPKQFVYLHLILPHKPYLVDSLGNVLDMRDKKNVEPTVERMMNQVKYSNLLIDSLFKEIKSADSNSIVLVMSDHGYREYDDPQSLDVFNNYLALSTPDMDYEFMKDVRSNINVMPALLNKYYGQNIPMQEDKLFFFEQESNQIIRKEFPIR